MTPEDSANDKELLERYRRASDSQPATPSDAVRAAILAEGRRVAEQRAHSASQRPFDVSRRAANDSRWKITAFGTAGAALVAALLFAPRLWENGKVPVQASNSSAAPEAAPRPTSPVPSTNNFNSPATSVQAAPKAESLQPLQQDRQGTLAELAPAEKKKYAPSRARAAADAAPSAASSAAAAEPSGLLVAAALGDTAKIQTLMDQGAALNERDELGRTPLMLAVIDGRPEVVRLLLDRGADPNAADNSGRTPLQMARQAGLRQIATLLEQSGARQNAGK
jgi:hypothetical protein